MSLWKRTGDDRNESSESEEDVVDANSKSILDFTSPLSTRETEKALRKEANSPYSTQKQKANN